MDDLHGISDDAMSEIDDLRTAMGTETLAANDIVLEGFENRHYAP